MYTGKCIICITNSIYTISYLYNYKNSSEKGLKTVAFMLMLKNVIVATPHNYMFDHSLLHVTKTADIVGSYVRSAWCCRHKLV